MLVDLHLHSTTSDGSLSPGALVSAARAGGLHVISLTDHDTVAGVAEARAAGAGSIEVIPGVEISSTHDSAELHILGYFIDALHPGMVAYSTEAASRRTERVRGMIERLRGMGIIVPFDEVVAVAGPQARALGRPHLARALVQRGHAHSFADAFDRFIGDSAPAFLPTNLLAERDAIALIHEAGGVAVWAHPRPDAFERSIQQLVDWGLDGVECFRPRCPPEESLHLEGTCRTLGLLVTGGSDWHGTWHGRLGSFSVGREEVGAFLERGGI